jgi:fermentation-respiration switch protein FrsA (DUF1100 family)
MSLSRGLLPLALALGVAIASPEAGVSQAAPAYEISSARVEAALEALKAQKADPLQQRSADGTLDFPLGNPEGRQGGTQPQDWDYVPAPGVTSRQVSFYVDGGTRLYGKIFYPKDFTASGSWPAVAVGHGINAISLGVEKHAARFAERGLVAMVIDYQSYGFSDSGEDEILLMEPDISTDAAPVVHRQSLVAIKRTQLNNVHQVENFRAAVSYLQGEPGVDPGRIGVWGSSNGGMVVTAVAGIDARVKAVVAQVIAVAPTDNPGGLLRSTSGGNASADAVQRVKTGQGGQGRAGFSFRSFVDSFANRVHGADVQAGARLARVRPSTAILFLPAEFDELGSVPAVAQRAVTYLRSRGVPSQVITLRNLGHFEPYAGAGFEVASNLAADWFLKQLGPGRPSR